jgi:heptosyltransferase-2
MAANLYIQTAFLGDLCLAVPTLKRIKKLRPQSPLILICRQGLGSLMKSISEIEPLVDRVFEVEKGNSRSYQEVLKEVSKLEFEWIFCPHESLRSAWFQKGLKARKKIGYAKWWNGPFFDVRLQKPTQYPEAIRQMSLLNPVDSELKEKIATSDFEISNSDLLSPVPGWASPLIQGLESRPEHQALLLRFQLKENRVVFFPGSVWETKKWTLTGFQTVAANLERLGYQVILLGSKEERELCHSVRLATKEGLNLAGELSLLESLHVLAGAKLALCNDSGGQHLASLTGTPTLSIFGPTVLSQGFRPWNSRALVAENSGLSCRPCGRHGHKKCPIGTHECMNGLESGRVQDKALRLLTQYNPSR